MSFFMFSVLKKMPLMIYGSRILGGLVAIFVTPLLSYDGSHQVT